MKKKNDSDGRAVPAVFMQLMKYLPGYPELSGPEQDRQSARESILLQLSDARARLESVEVLAEASMRDSRLLAGYLHKDLKDLTEHLASLGALPPEMPSSGLRGILYRVQKKDASELDELLRFAQSNDDSRGMLSGALAQAGKQLDYIEWIWKSIEPDFVTGRDRYQARLKRIAWSLLAVLLLTSFAGYRIHRDQPEQKFYRKHLQPLKAVVPSDQFEKLEGLARSSRADFLRVEDLLKIRIGLESFFDRRGRFPGSQGKKFSSDGDRGVDWIPELRSVVPVPLPVDRREGGNPEQQYLYISDSKDYKILARQPQDCEAVKQWMPEIVDPVRGCAAIGFWTADGKGF